MQKASPGPYLESCTRVLANFGRSISWDHFFRKYLTMFNFKHQAPVPPTPPGIVDLTGKTILITGSNQGMPEYQTEAHLRQQELASHKQRFELFNADR